MAAPRKTGQSLAFAQFVRTPQHKRSNLGHVSYRDFVAAEVYKEFEYFKTFKEPSTEINKTSRDEHPAPALHLEE